MNDKGNSIEVKRFWLGVFLVASGVGLLFTGAIFDPQGKIDSSILTGFGEIATLAGALLGMDAYTSFKIRKALNKQE